MKNVAVLTASAAAFGLLCTASSAQLAIDQTPLASSLTFNEAIAIALEEQPGTIAEIALERSNGNVVIDIEVINDVGDEIEFHLDPETGEILSSWTDDDPSNDPGETDDEDSDG